MSIWVVCADSARARIFSATRAGVLTEFEDLVHPESRNHNRDLVSDRPGRSSAPSGQRHTVGHESEPSEHEAQRFAKELAAFLNKAFHKERVQRLHLVAAPAFLGMLRTYLDAPLRACVKSETASNLITESAENIRARLPTRLGSLDR